MYIKKHRSISKKYKLRSRTITLAKQSFKKTTDMSLRRCGCFLLCSISGKLYICIKMGIL